MLDKFIVPRLKPPLRLLAVKLDVAGLSADSISMVGFGFGIAAVVLVAAGHFELALLGLFLNRLADGVDGELARLHRPTDAGGFLDITLDFVFYALFPLGFAVHNPDDNALAAACLIASFVGTGASFLAFATQAEKQGIQNPSFSYKSLYYLDGLAEGTETIICFVLMLLFPEYFVWLAYGFAMICLITSTNRIVFGYQTLKNNR